MYSYVIHTPVILCICKTSKESQIAGKQFIHSNTFIKMTERTITYLGQLFIIQRLRSKVNITTVNLVIILLLHIIQMHRLNIDCFIRVFH